jgi:hypothetical protein
MPLSINLNLAEILEEKYPHGFHVPADIDISNVIEFGDDDWEHPLDIDAHLEAEDKIALIWSVSDVLERRADLTMEQAWKVLTQGREQFLEGRCHLDFLEVTANQLFPVGANATQFVMQRLRSLLTDIEAAPNELLGAYGAVERTRELLDDLEHALNVGAWR